MLLLLYGCADGDHPGAAVSVISGENSAYWADVSEAGTSKAGASQGVQDTAVAGDHSSAQADAAQTLSPEAAGGTQPDEVRGTKLLAVFVCGAVKHPGVYELQTGSRVYEALALAGGLTDEASTTAVNQAELLSDGQMIRIPTMDEAQAEAAEEEARSDGLININTADLEELKTLPGIGDSKARSIIAYREKNGAFRSIEELKNIEGIKDGVFAQLEGCIKAE